ncbi:MAG: FdhF/YdeP family oxidoreductase [Myxococcota bacterium]
MTAKRSDEAEPPRDTRAPDVSAPPKVAAGPSAVLSTARFIGASTRGLRTLRHLNQVDGVDCPSCAWPDPKHRSSFEFCENGAKAIAYETMAKTIDGRFFAAHSIPELLAESDRWHDAQGRIVEPLLRDEGSDRYRAIPWNEAFTLIGDTLRGLETADEAIFYTSGRASNEAAFTYGLLARALGTNNLPDCSNMCHESSGRALGEAIGIGKGTVQLEDFAKADVILCAGQNPGTNHPRMLSTLAEAAEAGAHIVAINPLEEAGLVAFAHPQKASGLLGQGAPISADHLRVRVNGDLALFRGLAKAVLELGADEAFIDEHTVGLGPYRARVRATEWDEIEAMSGIARKPLQRLAARLRSGKLITCWAMGLTQHRNAVHTLREVVNLHLLVGAVGKPGAGFCPVRGHSNVQGDRTMGICERMPDAFFDRLFAATGIAAARHHGVDTVGAIEAMHDGRARFFMGLGGNFLQASPDTDLVARAFERCDLTVQVSTKLNRGHLITGKRALILPCLGRSERDLGPDGKARFVTTENSMGLVQSSEGRLAPIGAALRSEVDIVLGIAKAAVGDGGAIRWDALADYAEIRRLIQAVIPGFDDYETRARGGGFALPNGARERVWNTASRKAEFSDHPLSAFVARPGHFVLQTLRSHDQFNTTIYGEDDRYRGVRGGRRVVFMHPKDMERLGLRALQPVDLTSHFEGQTRRVEHFRVVPYALPVGSLAAYFPEANPLVPAGSYAEGSRTPTSKSVEVSVRPTPTAVAGVPA